MAENLEDMDLQALPGVETSTQEFMLIAGRYFWIHSTIWCISTQNQVPLHSLGFTNRKVCKEL